MQGGNLLDPALGATLWPMNLDPAMESGQDPLTALGTHLGRYQAASHHGVQTQPLTQQISPPSAAPSNAYTR